MYSEELLLPLEELLFQHQKAIFFQNICILQDITIFSYSIYSTNNRGQVDATQLPPTSHLVSTRSLVAALTSPGETKGICHQTMHKYNRLWVCTLYFVLCSVQYKTLLLPQIFLSLEAKVWKVYYNLLKSENMGRLGLNNFLKSVVCMRTELRGSSCAREGIFCAT